MKNHPYRAQTANTEPPRYLVLEAVLWLGHKIEKYEFWIVALSLIAAVWP